MKLVRKKYAVFQEYGIIYVLKNAIILFLMMDIQVFFFYFLNEEKAATNNYNFCPVIYLNQKSCVLSLKKYICWSSWYVKMVDSQILYRISRSFRVSQNLRKRGIFFFLLICVNYFFCDSKSFLLIKQYQI